MGCGDLVWRRGCAKGNITAKPAIAPHPLYSAPRIRVSPHLPWTLEILTRSLRT
jgi:hypothetical protein